MVGRDARFRNETADRAWNSPMVTLPDSHPPAAGNCKDVTRGSAIGRPPRRNAATKAMARRSEQVKTIVVTPDPALLESMRSIGYTVESAVADVIDNSVAANASH